MRLLLICVSFRPNPKLLWTKFCRGDICVDIPDPKDGSPNENPGAWGLCIANGPGAGLCVANGPVGVCDWPRPKAKPPPKLLTIQEVIEQGIETLLMYLLYLDNHANIIKSWQGTVKHNMCPEQETWTEKFKRIPYTWDQSIWCFT